MKKTIIASSLAVGLGLVAGNVSHADASETQINKEKLAQLAESNDQSLNQHPIQEGAYNTQFNLNGKTYHFWSDGTHFNWEYHASNGSNLNSANQNVNSTQTAQNESQSQQNDNYANTNQSTSTSNVNQHYANEAQTQQTPKSTQTQQVNQTQAQTQQAPANTTTNQPKQSTSGSSVNVNGHLQQIAQRESGGDIHAINPSSGAAGKYQFLQSTWDSVAPAQYKGVSPAQAPENVQDAAAVKLYNNAGPSQWVTA